MPAIEISFNPLKNKPIPYTVNSGTRFGNYTQGFNDLKQTKVEMEEEKNALDASTMQVAQMFSRLFALSSMYNAEFDYKTNPKLNEYSLSLPPNYLKKIIEEEREKGRRYIVGSASTKPLISFREGKKVTFL